MSGRNIHGAEFELAKIFSSEFDYSVPSYQRPYAWTTDQATELFDDLYDFYQTEKEDSYFLGSIVIIKEEGKSHAEVIDGQQRLTTLTILLAVISDQFEGDLRADFESYIREPGRLSQGLQPKPRLALRERDREFFEKYVQSLRLDQLLALDAAQLDNESQMNIRTNAKVLRDRVVRELGGDTEAVSRFGAFLVTRCFLVAVSTPNQKSAFRVFSVMNSRGLDLQPTDILKAETIGKIHDQSEQNSYNERWEDMEVELGRDGFNDLFAFVRMIYGKKKAKRALLEEFREQVLPKIKTSNELVGEVLEPFAESLAVLRQAQYKSEVDADKVNWYLHWLHRIDNSDWIPPAMLFLAQKKENAEYVRWFFERMERLAAFMHVSAKNVNERIERYESVISTLEKNHDLDNPVREVELSESERSEMKSALRGDIYYLTARRRNYVLLRLDSFLSDGSATYDANLLTIEHVLPQTVDSGSQWEKDWPEFDEREQWVHKLANLVPLNKRRNSAAQNYDFERKKSAYFQGRENVSSYALTSQVLNEPEWTPHVVQKRQDDLLATLEKGWRL